MNESIKTAVHNVAEFGDTDVFPYSFEQHVFRDRPELVTDCLSELHRDFGRYLAAYSPDNISALSAVGYTGFRWATQIDPFWNAYYLALVVELGGEVEAARMATRDGRVFSYRFVGHQCDGSIFHPDINWHAFMDRSVKLAEQCESVVVCDISDFYSRIYHHRLENALRWANANVDFAGKLVRLLQVFSGGVSYGLPVGGPASRLLAELALNSVDRLLASEGVGFCRFVDDYRLFCRDKGTVHEGLIFLVDKLANEGLTLQKSKTRVLTSKEYCDEVRLLLRSHQADTDKLTEEDKLMRLSLHFDPYSETSVDDYERLKGEVKKVDIAGILARELEKTRIDPAVARRAMAAVRLLPPNEQKPVIQSILGVANMHTLAPIFPRVMMVLRGVTFSPVQRCMR